MSNEPAAKRTKLEAPSREAELFGQSNESGLFFALRSTLGLRASTEEEVGITEYVDPTIPPFEGIIKHRCVSLSVEFVRSVLNVMARTDSRISWSLKWGSMERSSDFKISHNRNP